MAELLKLLSCRRTSGKEIIIVALHADPDTKLYDLTVKAVVDRLEGRHCGQRDEASIMSDLEGDFNLKVDYLPQHFVDRVCESHAGSFAWMYELL